ncbi:MAG: hypothetical protein ABI647_11110 [Gemmatimonadota bacterium]
MLKVFSTEAAIIACHAEPAALGRLAAPDGGFVARIAPDEVWLIGRRTARAELVRRAEEEVGAPAGDGFVADQTDGWAIWSVGGALVREVLGRLTIIEIPAAAPAFVQGAISGAPGKILVDGDVAHLMVPSPLGHHLRDRIVAVCGDLEPALDEPRAFVLSVGAR